jgi:hypothetical protein
MYQTSLTSSGVRSCTDTCLLQWSKRECRGPQAAAGDK